MVLKLDIKKYGAMRVDCILAHGKAEWWTHVKEVMNIPGAKNFEITL
jgi:hypothetical protein